MIYDDQAYEYILASGRRCYANGGILGIGPDGQDASEGYDGGLYPRPGEDFTLAERREIAGYAIEQWVKWAEDGEPDEECENGFHAFPSPEGEGRARDEQVCVCGAFTWEAWRQGKTI